MSNNIVDCVIEECDKPSHADDGQRLTGEDTEDHGSESRREQCFVDAEELSGSSIHVERKGNGGKEAYTVSPLTESSSSHTYLTKYMRTVLAKVRYVHASARSLQ